MKRRHDRARADKRRGLAAVELATFLPLLTLLFLGMCDYSRVFYYKITLNNCARNGALFANNPSLVGTTYPNPTLAAQANATNYNVLPSVTTTSGTDTYGKNYTDINTSYTFTPLFNCPWLANSVPPNSVLLSSKVRMMKSPL